MKEIVIQQKQQHQQHQDRGRAPDVLKYLKNVRDIRNIYSSENQHHVDTVIRTSVEKIDASNMSEQNTRKR